MLLRVWARVRERARDRGACICRAASSCLLLGRGAPLPLCSVGASDAVLPHRPHMGHIYAVTRDLGLRIAGPHGCGAGIAGCRATAAFGASRLAPGPSASGTPSPDVSQAPAGTAAAAAAPLHVHAHVHHVSASYAPQGCASAAAATGSGNAPVSFGAGGAAAVGGVSHLHAHPHQGNWQHALGRPPHPNFRPQPEQASANAGSAACRRRRADT